MRVSLGEKEYVELKITDDNFMSLSIKARKTSDSFVMISSKLDMHDLNDIISFLVANKSNISVRD
jgi:hypothetical protein